ncbi:MAG TPA: pyruvate kinase, partial [Dongiaceae bacterium]|nr:pyruvate kinase [Dongiaceae bacterium]
MRRLRKAKILATLGPASGTLERIQALVAAGADVFRLNLSHGTHADHRLRYDLVRQVEQDTGRPIGVLVDLQGPKLRVGAFEGGGANLAAGSHFRLDLSTAPGNSTRAPLPHPEVLAALKPGAELLLDDGRIRLRVDQAAPDCCETTVVTG